MAEYTTAQRKKAEAEGETAYGTSYPMETCEDVRHAIEAYGRAPEHERATLRRAIMHRRAELGCDVEIPSTWKVTRGDR